MDIQNATQFITQEFIWLVPCLMIIGKIIKEIPKVPNWIIPICLVAIGIVLGGATGTWTQNAIIQGLICGLCSTGLHQTITQPMKK